MFCPEGGRCPRGGRCDLQGLNIIIFFVSDSLFAGWSELQVWVLALFLGLLASF